MATMGRPSKFDPEFHPKDYLERCKTGQTKAMICSEWEIARDTLYQWAERDDFSYIYKRGNELRVQYWERMGISNLDNSNYNTRLFMFFAKSICRQDYAEEQTLNVNKKDMTVAYPLDE